MKKLKQTYLTGIMYTIFYTTLCCSCQQPPVTVPQKTIAVSPGTANGFGSLTGMSVGKKESCCKGSPSRLKMMQATHSSKNEIKR